MKRAVRSTSSEVTNLYDMSKPGKRNACGLNTDKEGRTNESPTYRQDGNGRTEETLNVNKAQIVPHPREQQRQP